MLGIPIRLHDLTGEDIGTAHVPWPVELGDLVLTEHGEYVVHDVVETGQTFPIAAFAKVRPANLRPAGGHRVLKRVQKRVQALSLVTWHDHHAEPCAADIPRRGCSGCGVAS